MSNIKEKSMQKIIFTTTLSQLRKAGACYSGYNKLVRSIQAEPFTDSDKDRESFIRFAHKEPINLLHILESNGVEDCLWALRPVVHPELDRIARHIACDCADQVIHIFESAQPGDSRPRIAIGAARKFADGESPDGEMDAARAAAGAAAGAATRAAAWAAAWAAARAAASAAAWAAAGAAAGAAARAAAWAAAGDAAWDAAWDAARAAAWDAAGDAARADQAKIIKSYLSDESTK